MTTPCHGSSIRSLVLLAGLHALSACGASAADPLPGARQQAASPADSIVGVWRVNEMDADIQIYSAQGQYVGAVVRSANPAMMNAGILRGVTFDPASNTWRGEAFAVKRGMFVPMTIRLTSATGLEMTAGSGIMSKTMQWSRVQ